MEDEEEPEEEDDDDQAKVEDEDASATEEWESEGEHEEDEEASATEQGESEGEHEGVGADDGAQSFLSRRLPRRRTMTILTRWRMRKRLPPRKRSRRWTTRRTSDTIPTEKSTSGLSIKLPCKIPCLPISILQSSRGNSQCPFYLEHSGSGHLPFCE